MILNLLLFRFTSFISYLLRAKGPHSVHSPFVFGLIKKCIKTSSKTRFKEIEELKKSLSRDHQLVEVMDLKNSRSSLKRVSAIARHSSSSRRFSTFLYHLANYVDSHSVLETGTSLGINSLYLAKSNVRSLTTIEGSQVIAALAAKNIQPRTQKARIVNGDIYKTLEEEIVRSKPDLYFLDADHRSTAVAFCIDLILKHTPNAKCIVIHDIYWSIDMKEMWLSLISDPRFNLSIDLFQGGLLFPNIEMPKQHFALHF